MKFSIIIPVYNVEEYIEKCLKSIERQTYVNFEVIIINDGSPDKSEKIISNFIKNKPKFRYYKKENGGLSDARNYGLKYVTGDYLLFIDSDDYVNVQLLEMLNNELMKNNVDIVKFGVDMIKKDEVIHCFKTNFNNLDLLTALPLLLKDELFEPAWLYCYNYNFWKKNNFLYTKGKSHEDYGLTPIILSKAKKISSIDYIGYNYIIRENSIMTTNDEKKAYQKFQDILYYYDKNITIIQKIKDEKVRSYLSSYYANGVINKAKSLKGKNRKIAFIEIKQRKLYRYLLDNTLKRKLKKLAFYYFPGLILRGKNEKN